MPESGDIFAAKLSLRSNFAIHHLRAAVRDALSAHEVEQANDITKHGPWFDDMLVHVPVSVVMAAAALEANSNEIIQDILDRPAKMRLADSRKVLLADLKDDRSGNAMGKYRKLALILDKIPNKGTSAWQNADLLFKFRNSFMHFKPAWDHETDIHDGQLVRELRKRVPVTPSHKPSFMFPYSLMTYGCAKWTVESAVTFAAEFCTLIGVEDSFKNKPVLP